MVHGGYRRKADTWRYEIMNDDPIRVSKTITLGTYDRRQQRIYQYNICAIIKVIKF